MPEYRRMELGNVAGGALPELFRRALDEVMENIQDPNTPVKTTRQITMKLTFEPRESSDGARREGFVELDVRTKLAGVKPVVGNFFWSKKDQDTYTNDPVQEELLEAEGVQNINRGRKAGGEG